MARQLSNLWAEQFYPDNIDQVIYPGNITVMTPSKTVKKTEPHRTYAAFASDELVASGDLRTVLSRAKARVDRGEARGVLFFDDETGRQVDMNLEGTPGEVLAREIPEPAPRPRGRPKLGVTAREVTLLPRHWEWLQQQPRGISATLRRLVEEARKREPDREAKRIAREAAHRFMTAMAGDRAGYEEALRALYAEDREGFDRHIKRWPLDVRRHASRLADASF